MLGGLTRDYTGTPCDGDVVSLTCTLPGVSLEWDVPESRDLRVDDRTKIPFQRDQYTVTSFMLNFTSVTTSLSFPAAKGTIGCFPSLQTMMRNELTILTASEIPLM